MRRAPGALVRLAGCLILDAGPNYADYHVDISTTFPASGSFTARQGELYEAALAVHDACLANYRPGISFKQVGARVAAMLEEKGLEEIGIRIEDTVAITETGCENLSLGVPRTGAEIETLMRTDGILQVLRDRGLVRGE